MDFQDNEYKSKVLALMTQIQKIAKFQADILGNDELRLSEIENLNRLENECIQLLGQANLTIAGYAKKKDLDYEAYEKELAEIHKWFVYQKTLIEIVVKMAEIKHTLYFGKISKEQCCALLDIYSKQVRETLEQLSEWHKLQIEKFDIHVDESMRKRIGIDGIIHFIPSLISEEQRYRSISENIMKNIITQMQGYAVPTNIGMMDLFQEDVRLF